MDSLNLSKGDVLDLHKVDANLEEVAVALGWKANDGNGEDFDLDASCFLLKANGKLVNGSGSVVFYKQPKIAAPAVVHTGDERKGQQGGNTNDCETIEVNFPILDPKCERIDFIITIYVDPNTGAGSTLSFRHVKNAYARVYNKKTGKEICKYNLTTDFGSANSVLVCSLNKKGASWEFEAVGSGQANADINTYYQRYQ